MSYLNDFTNDSWDHFFQNLSLDVRTFFAAPKPLDNAAQTKNVLTIKQKKLPKKGNSLQAIIDDIRTNVLPGSIHQHHKNYIAFPDKGSLAPAQYAAMLSALTNQNTIAEDKSAPTGTYIEMRVISWIRGLIDFAEKESFPESALELGGAFVTGGVMANTVGLLGARQRAFPESKVKGMHAIQQTPKIFVAGSTMSHYSHFGSGWWLGFGTENMVEIKCTKKGNMDQKDLEQKIQETIKRGEKPVAIIALAGDSRANTIDDLPGIYKIAQKYGVWLHADACHGGILAFDATFTHQGKHFFYYCDSVTMDPHKHLGIPYANSIVLFKNPYDLAAIGSSTDITIAYGSADIGQITPFAGSRAFDALKLYATIQHYGTDGLKAHIDKRRQITRQWYDLLKQSKILMPMHEPELFAQAFTIRPNAMSPEELTEHNKLLHDEIYKNGEVVIHKFAMRDYRNVLGYGPGVKVTTFGSLIGYDMYTKEDLGRILKVIESTYDSLFGVSVPIGPQMTATRADKV